LRPTSEVTVPDDVRDSVLDRLLAIGHGLGSSSRLRVGFADLRPSCLARRAAEPEQPFAKSVATVRRAVVTDLVASWFARGADPAITLPRVYSELLRGPDGADSWAWRWLNGANGDQDRASRAERMLVQQDAIALAAEAIRLLGELGCRTVRVATRTSVSVGFLRIALGSALVVEDVPTGMLWIASSTQASQQRARELGLAALVALLGLAGAHWVGLLDVARGELARVTVGEEVLGEGIAAIEEVVERELRRRELLAEARAGGLAVLWEWASPGWECRICELAEQCPVAIRAPSTEG
jgi:hypothetical protein